MTSERRSRDEADQLAWEEPRATQKTDTEDPNIATLRETLRQTLNRHSAENGSNTPDFILAEYLLGCLAAWDAGVTAREKWYGREKKAASAEIAAALNGGADGA